MVTKSPLIMSNGRLPAGADTLLAPWNREDYHCEVDSIEITDSDDVLMCVTWVGVDDYLVGTEEYPSEVTITIDELLKFKGIQQ